MISTPENFSGQALTDSSGAIAATDTGHAPASAPEFSFDIPAADAEFFAKRVEGEERRRVRHLLAALATIHHSGKINPTIRRLAPSLQMNFYSLRRHWYAYTGGCEKADQIFLPGDWRSVLDWNYVSSEKVNLPFPFLEFWRKLGEQNQRCWKTAWDELMQIIRTHQGFPHGRQGPQCYKSIPGFSEWPQVDAALGWPPGMSYGHLMRYKSDPFETSLVRHGRAKASALRLPVLKTRVGREFGSALIFDDHDFDEKVLFQRRLNRPMGFGCVEYLSAAMVKLGVKPMLFDEEENKKRVLTEREFMWFFLSVICGFGYSPNGCRFDMENAKATIREPWLSRFQAVLGDKFIFNFGTRPGNFVKSQIAGQFSGQPKGNFRTKALVESFWSPLNNQTAMLLGQMGKDRDHAPAQLYGAEKYTTGLIRQAEERNVALDNLQFPFHTYQEWCRHVYEALSRINLARDHQIEGWEKCGFVRRQWRENDASEIWLEQSDFAALPETTRSIIARRLETNPRLVTVCQDSRWDVVQRFRHTLTQFPLIHIPEILGREFALVTRHEDGLAVEKGLFSFDCAEIDSDTIHFYARDARGFLREGDRFVCFVNPYLSTHLIACDQSLRVVAICERYYPAANEAGLKQALGAQQSFEAAARVRLNLRHDDVAKANRAMREHNETQFAGAAGQPVITGTPSAPGDCTKELLARDEAALPAPALDEW